MQVTKQSCQSQITFTCQTHSPSFHSLTALL